MKKRFLVFCLAFVCVLGLAAEGLAFRTGYLPSPVDLSHLAKNPPKTVRTAEALPSSYDLRDHIRMPPVRNQAPFGTCWAHATMSSMETNALKQGILTSPNLSEFHLAWFAYGDKRPGKSFTPGDLSEVYGNEPFDPILDQAGQEFMVLALLTRPAGPTDEVYAPYPTSLDYEPLPGVPEDPSLYPRELSIKDVKFVGEPDSSAENRELLKQLILENGAASISYYSDGYQDKRSKDQSAYYFNNSNVNHSVLVVGWDDSFPKERFNPEQPSINGAWLVRNSWGEKWGKMGGYFYMSYEQYIDSACSYVVERADGAVNSYGYDDLGWCDQIGFPDAEGRPLPTLWAANVFRAPNNELLKQAAFYTYDNNTDYELRVYALGDGAPQSPTVGMLLTSQSGTLPYCGYHKIDIKTDTPLTGGHYFSVVVRIDDPNGACFPVECARPYPCCSEETVVNEGESYLSEDGKKWEDSYFDGIPGNAYNVCIKAFTVDGGSGSGYNGGHGGDGSSVQPQAVEITSEKKEQVRSAIEDLDLPGVDLSSVDVLTFCWDTVTMGSTRDASMLADEETNAVSDDRKVPAAILPEITILKTGIYCFLTSLDIAIPEGAVLEWHSFPQTDPTEAELVSAQLAGAGDRTAVFMKDGRVITTVPADHEVEVAAYFEEYMTYAPVIAAVTASGGGENGENDEDSKDGKDSPTPTSDKGSGGCSAGFGALAVLAVLFGAASFVRKRR